MPDTPFIEDGSNLPLSELRWPNDDLTRIPDWIYTSDEVFQRERERIFFGESWCFVALEAEIPDPGSFKRSYVGDVPVIVSRDEDGADHRPQRTRDELALPASLRSTLSEHLLLAQTTL